MSSVWSWKSKGAWPATKRDTIGVKAVKAGCKKVMLALIKQGDVFVVEATLFLGDGILKTISTLIGHGETEHEAITNAIENINSVVDGLRCLSRQLDADIDEDDSNDEDIKNNNHA